MFLILSLFTTFPSRKDDIFKSANDISSIKVEASGSIGQFHNGRCIFTNPNTTLATDDRSYDWCSNIAKNKNEFTWISYSLSNKLMKIRGYSIRSGCCYTSCCCLDDELDIYCCCDMYSFSLQASNDNKTWKVLHKVEKDKNFPSCTTKTFSIQESGYFRYIKFVNDEQFPGCPNCMAINQFALYGDLQVSSGTLYTEEENEEDVSIIGKIRNPEE